MSRAGKRTPPGSQQAGGDYLLARERIYMHKIEYNIHICEQLPPACLCSPERCCQRQSGLSVRYGDLSEHHLKKL